MSDLYCALHDKDVPCIDCTNNDEEAKYVLGLQSQRAAQTQLERPTYSLTEEEKEQFQSLFFKLSLAIHHSALAHGFWERQNDGEKIALMHSELSEALECVRKDESQMDRHCPGHFNLPIELSDCIIRIIDYAMYKNLNLCAAMFAKVEFNLTRPFKHDKIF